MLRLGEWSFWPDEFFTISGKEDGFNYSLLRRSLGSDLVQWTVQWLGASEWSARLTPALIGAISVPLLYLLLRRCMPRAGALLAGALLAISPWHLYWSQNARFYVLLFLFFNLGLLFFYLGLERDRPWLMLASLVLFGLAARERLAALVGIPALVVYLLLLVLAGFERPKGFNWRSLGVFFGPALLGGLVLVFPYAANFSGWMSGFGFRNNSPFSMLTSTLYYVGLPLAVFAAGGALFALRRKDRFALLLSLSAVLPLALLMGIALVQYTASRYVFFSLFSWIALAGLAFQALADRLSSPGQPAGVWLRLAVAGALLAAYAGDTYLYYDFQNGNRGDYRAAFNYISAHLQEGDEVVTPDPDMAGYYMGRMTRAYAPWHPERVAQMERVWFVEDLYTSMAYPEQWTWVHEHARLMADFDVHLPGRTFTMRVYLKGEQ